MSLTTNQARVRTYLFRLKLAMRMIDSRLSLSHLDIRVVPRVLSD